jgi:hypothetical protein
VKWIGKLGAGPDDRPKEPTGWRRRILNGTEQSPDEELKQAQDVLTWAQRKHAPDSPFTTRATLDVADQLARQDRTAEEVELREQVVLQLRTSLGPENVGTASAEMKLAGCLVKLQRFEEADLLLAHVVAVRTNELGPDNPDTLRAIEWREVAAANGGQTPESLQSPTD